MGPVKIVADLWCDPSKPVREGHFFNVKRIRSIGLNIFGKNIKKTEISQNADFSVLRNFSSFLDFSQDW